MITPTVGRIVHVFRRGHQEPIAAIIDAIDDFQPSSQPPTVWVTPFPPRGGGLSCPAHMELYDPGEGVKSIGDWWAEWMPYQAGQAAKTDDVASVLTGRIERLGNEMESADTELEARMRSLERTVHALASGQVPPGYTAAEIPAGDATPPLTPEVVAPNEPPASTDNQSAAPASA